MSKIEKGEVKQKCTTHYKIEVKRENKTLEAKNNIGATIAEARFMIRTRMYKIAPRQVKAHVENDEIPMNN